MSFSDRVRRWHSPSVFTLIALCFLLPFATVTFVSGCGEFTDGQTSFTGIQLVTRTVPRGTGMADCRWRADGGGGRPDQCVEKEGATTAEVAFAAVIVGVVLGLLGIAGGGWCALVGLAAFLQLLFTVGDFKPHVGYALAFGLLVWAGILHFRRLRKRRPSGVHTGTGFRGALGAMAITALAILVAILCGTVHAFWLAPLVWVLGVSVLRAVKTGDVGVESPSAELESPPAELEPPPT